MYSSDPMSKLWGDAVQAFAVSPDERMSVHPGDLATQVRLMPWAPTVLYSQARISRARQEGCSFKLLPPHRQYEATGEHTASSTVALFQRITAAITGR